MPYIILDRDGVINFDSDEYIKSPDEWLPIPGSLEAIATLNKHGFSVVVATNQSGVARGYYDLEILGDIHDKMVRELAAVGGYVEEIFYCPHHPKENCFCRKPQPGLFHQIQAKYPFVPEQTFFIGDSLTDVQVAQSVGCKPLLVLTGKGEKTVSQNPEVAQIPQFANLAAAVEFVLRENQ